MSNVKKKFSKLGIHLVISDSSLIKTLCDKNRADTFFKNLKIKTPKRLNKNNLIFPVFIKPIDGYNSRGIYRANNINEVKPSDLSSKKIIISENIDKNDYDEYTIDMYYDKKSILKCAVPRIRLKVVGGESNQGITLKNEVYNFVINKFCFIKGAIGCLTLQLFSNKKTPKDIYGIEINPRFGGGYPFSLNAGANYPEFIIREYILEEKINFYDNWRNNCLNIRYEKEIVIYDK